MGYDFSGVISAVHTDDQDGAFQVGDSVFAVNWGLHKHDDDTAVPGGAFAEYILIPSAKLSKKPEGITFEQAAAVALVGTTARQVTFNCAAVKSTQKVKLSLTCSYCSDVKENRKDFFLHDTSAT